MSRTTEDPDASLLRNGPGERTRGPWRPVDGCPVEVDLQDVREFELDWGRVRGVEEREKYYHSKRVPESEVWKREKLRGRRKESEDDRRVQDSQDRVRQGKEVEKTGT